MLTTNFERMLILPGMFHSHTQGDCTLQCTHATETWTNPGVYGNINSFYAKPFHEGTVILPKMK